LIHDGNRAFARAIRCVAE